MCYMLMAPEEFTSRATIPVELEGLNEEVHGNTQDRT